MDFLDFLLVFFSLVLDFSVVFGLVGSWGSSVCGLVEGLGCGAISQDEPDDDTGDSGDAFGVISPPLPALVSGLIGACSSSSEESLDWFFSDFFFSRMARFSARFVFCSSRIFAKAALYSMAKLLSSRRFFIARAVVASMEPFSAHWWINREILVLAAFGRTEVTRLATVVEVATGEDEDMICCLRCQK